MKRLLIFNLLICACRDDYNSSDGFGIDTESDSTDATTEISDSSTSDSADGGSGDSSTSGNETDDTDSDGESDGDATSTGDGDGDGDGDGIFFFDEFTEDIGQWVYSGDDGYALVYDTDGMPPGSAKISGDALPPATARMVRQVDLSEWDGQSLVLQFDARATSTSMATNASIWVVDADTQDELFSETFIDDVSMDSGWDHYSYDLTQAIGDSTAIQIELGLIDSWDTDWNLTSWFDNVLLTE